MGSCLSKKSSCKTTTVTLPNPLKNLKPVSQLYQHKTGGVANKDILIQRSNQDNGNNGHCKSGNFSNCEHVNVIAAVRTSSCSNEDLDAILIQCGRLSRSNSTSKGAHSPARKSSGEGEDCTAVRERRRSPGREAGQPRSRRRVSRSPKRRSESPSNRNPGNSNSNTSADIANSRPGKMVAVPATVTDESGNGNAMQRMQVKGGRTVASQHACSQSRARTSSENTTCRRNPLSKIDSNIMTQDPERKPTCRQEKNTSLNCNEEQQVKGNKEESTIQDQVVVNVVSPGHENLKLQTVVRNRSSRLSRDLDIKPEILSNSNASSYTTLLLEDIQNFHQKNNPAAVLSLPTCVTKACNTSALCEDTQRHARFEQMNKTDNKVTSGNAKPDIRDPVVESEVAVNNDLMEPSFHRCVKGTAGAKNSTEKDPSHSNGFAKSQQ